MGRLQKIESVVNDTINHYGHIKIFPRSLPSFVDSLLRGTLRFGKRTGNSIALINPDNTYNFAEVPKLRSKELSLSTIPTWLNQDAVLSLGPGKELHQVDDISDNVVLLKKEIAREYTLEDKILLYAFPMILSVDVSQGDTFIIIKSHYQLGNGDVLAYLQTDGLLQSITEVKSSRAIFLGTSTDTFYSQIYRLELNGPINRKIIAGSLVYVRAYPAYFSPQIKVPNALFTANPLGPFLIDLLSGRLLEGNNFNETLAIKSFNRAGQFVLGNVSEFSTVEKNHVIVDRPWAAHYPMFWQLAEGTMRLTPTRVIFKVYANRLFRVGIKCIPNLPATGTQWRVSLSTNDDCTIRFIFKPHPAQEFALMSGSTSNVVIQIPAGASVTDVEINVLGNSSLTEVKMSDWSPVRDTIESIQYSYVIEAIGQATYQSTGLILKPFFMGSEFLTTSWDSGAIFDGGKIWG